MSEKKKNSYIITFKSKDKRADKKSDKADLFRSMVKAPKNVVDVLSTSRMPFPMTEENMVLDINEYEMPIMAATLTEQEHAAIRRDPNIKKVEPDGQCFALYDNSMPPFVHHGLRQPFPSTHIPYSFAPEACSSAKYSLGCSTSKRPTGLAYY